MEAARVYRNYYVCRVQQGLEAARAVSMGACRVSGWMVSKVDGKPITDASKSGEGVLLPIGGYKGSGLNIMIGLLAGTMNGAYFGKDVVDFNADPKAMTNTGQFFLALDPTRFMPMAQFGKKANETLDYLRATKPMPGQKVKMPGDERAVRQVERSSKGIAISPPLMKNLDALAARQGLPKLETVV